MEVINFPIAHLTTGKLHVRVSHIGVILINIQE